MSSGKTDWKRGKLALTACTTTSVEASARLVTGMYTVRRPSTSAYPV
jgi:hypothetical protein